MDENPFKAPLEVVATKARSPWVGNLVLVFAVVVYGPMTAIPISVAVMGREPFLPMLGASAFNGTVFAGLIYLGRWLRRRVLATGIRVNRQEAP